MIVTDNDFFISREKEVKDTVNLVSAVVAERWVDGDVVIVNCMPGYSSMASLVINHRLSYLNGHELFPCINLEMPYPNMSQVWDNEEGKYELYDTYLDKWIKKHVSSSEKYLFVSNAICGGRNFNKLKLALKDKVERENYRFITPYLQESSSFVPDHFMEKFEKRLLFWWENPKNPNLK